MIKRENARIYGAVILNRIYKPSQSGSADGIVNKKNLKQKLGKVFVGLAHTWKANNKFTIHPFRSLHVKHLLPLSLNDYLARFSLEIIVLIIGAVCIFANTALASHTGASAKADESVMFSFLRQNPSLNSALISENDTTVIVNNSDQWINKAFASPFSVVLASAATTSQAATSTTIQENVIVKTNPADTQNLRHGNTTYEVQSGDSLISIAGSYGISPATIIKENNLDPNGVIKPGQDLIILPVDGTSYTMKDGDTLEAIAKKYNVNLDDLMEVNDLELTTDAQPGDNIIIPGKVTLPSTAPKKYVTNSSGQIQLSQASAPASLSAGNLSFIWPTTTRTITQGFSSRHSGIDISDSKMEPIYASEAGFVESAGYVTSGYGNMILINHGGGFKTRYGHASELYVKAGQYVEKGQLIGKQGRTGHVVGVTGIHLHFEIIKNGKVVNPLLYVHP